MVLVVSGGNARSLAMEAITAAQNRDYLLADEKIELCNKALNQAHAVLERKVQYEITKFQKLST